MRTSTRCNGRRRSRARQRADVKTSLPSRDASWRQFPATVHAGQAVAESRPRVARATWTIPRRAAHPNDETGGRGHGLHHGERAVAHEGDWHPGGETRHGTSVRVAGFEGLKTKNRPQRGG